MNGHCALLPWPFSDPKKEMPVISRYDQLSFSSFLDAFRVLYFHEEII
jgi:hypothetical protein